jgi:hypothetical protein
MMVARMLREGKRDKIRQDETQADALSFGESMATLITT